MKCQVCGNESGKYVLCKACNLEKEKGLVAKCNKCNQWHYVSQPCAAQTSPVAGDSYVYEAKPVLISKNESGYYDAIKTALPEGCIAFPQINLAAFVTRVDNTRFHNELFRNVDFLIVNAEYKPLIVIEINDQTHLTAERGERDEKVKNICDEAGIPVISLWTSYGVNEEYIKKKIDETMASLPIPRVHHFDSAPNKADSEKPAAKSNDSGCYVATCVYGSYDCPQVWTLRRYRDHTLAKAWYGRAFIRIYYKISPALVNRFGNADSFKRVWKHQLDRLVTKLNNKGVEDTRYIDA